MNGFDARPRTGPEAMLEDYWRFFDMTPEERDREMQALCRTAMRQWLALPEDRRVRWPPEPGPHAEEILRRWAREFRERRAGSP
jgi:hypothetical protein